MTTTRFLLLAAALVALGWLIHELQPILMPFFVGAALAYFGDPVADRLEARGLSRTWAVVVVFSVLTVVFLLLVLLLVPMLGRQLAKLAETLPVVLSWLTQTALPWVELKLGVDLTAWRDLDLGELRRRVAAHWQGAGNVVGVVVAQATQSGLALMAFLANLALVPVVTFYLLRDWDVMIARIRESLPRRAAPTVSALARECDEVLSAFVRGQLMVMLALGITYWLGLWAVGLDLALLIGMLAGLGSIVPYLGFFIGIIAATIAAFFQFHDWLHLLLVWGVFGVGQILEGAVYTPWLVGDRIGMHPVAVIFAVLAGGQLFGFIGILLALPVAAMLMVLVRHAHRRYLASSLYAG